MHAKDQLQKRFQELAEQANRLHSSSPEDEPLETADWGAWSMSATSLLNLAFGSKTPHVEKFKAACKIYDDLDGEFGKPKGIFLGAKSDFEGGYFASIEKTVSSEVLGSFVALAKATLADGHKDVAAVLVSAALEDALKRYAKDNTLIVNGKDMSEVIGALKSKGLIGGTEKPIVEAMPKLRNAAMHADWSKISRPEVNSAIGYVEQFLTEHFS